MTDRDVRGEDHPRADTLVGFLLARLAEDERIARTAHDPRPGGSPPATTPATTSPAGDPATDLALHNARHDPERVLRDVAAKRAVVVAWLAAVRNQLVEHDHTDAMDVAETAIAHLAAVYVDHPDYREAWLGGTEPDADTAASDHDGGTAGNVFAIRSGDPRRRRRPDG